MGEISPGVTGLPLASMTLADDEFKNLPTSTILLSVIKISPMKLSPCPSWI